MAQYRRARWQLADIHQPCLTRVEQQRRRIIAAFFRLVKTGVKPLDRDRAPDFAGVRSWTSAGLRLLLAKLSRRDAVLALKQIAHNAGTGEAVILRHLLNRAAGSQQLLGGFAETQGGNVLHEANADLFMEQARKPGLRDKFGGSQFLQRDPPLIVGFDARYHVGNSSAPVLGAAAQAGHDRLGKTGCQQ